VKRIGLLLLSLVLIFSLSACSLKPTRYNVEYDGKTYKVDTLRRTVSDGTNTYEYSHFEGSLGRSFSINYPNGSRYYVSMNEGGGVLQEQKPDLWKTGYLSPSALRTIISSDVPNQIESNIWQWIIGLTSIGLGLIMMVKPRSVWYLEYGWKFKNAEPSDMALGANCLSGFVMVICGVILLFV
jgi:hypothetical protein